MTAKPGSDTPKGGERHLGERQARTELARVNRELKQLRAQLAAVMTPPGAGLAVPAEVPFSHFGVVIGR